MSNNLQKYFATLCIGVARLFFIIACTLLFIAQTSIAAIEQTDSKIEESFWSVKVNTIDRHEVDLFHVIDGKVLASGKDLQRWRLRLPTVQPHVYEGESFYPLEALKGTLYHIDEATQSIDINFPADQFIVSTISNATASPTPTLASLGGFLNYDANLQYSVGAQSSNNPLQSSALTELGIFNRWGVGTTTILGRNLSTSTEFVRLDTTWTHDMPESMASLRFGRHHQPTRRMGRSGTFRRYSVGY